MDCNLRKSKEHPDAFTKEELEALAIEYLGWTKNKAKNTTKVQICAEFAARGLDVFDLRRRYMNQQRSPQRAQSPRAQSPRRSPQRAMAGPSRISPQRVQSPRARSPRRSPQRAMAGPSRISPQRDVQSNVLPCVARSLKPLKPQQIEVVNYLEEHRGVLAVHALGSGKTLIAATASQCYLDSKPNGRVIFISPKSLTRNFLDTIAQYGADPEDPRIETYSFQSFVNASKRGEINCSRNLLIIDEAHTLRTAPSKGKGKKQKGVMAEHIIDCAQRASKVLLLTATPLVNKPKDLITLISMISGEDPISKATFRDILNDSVEFEEYFGGKVHFYSPDVTQMMKNYPRTIEHDVFIPMTSQYEKLYRDLENEQMTAHNVELYGDVDLRAFFNGIRRGSNNLLLEESPKVIWTLNKIEESRPRDRFVIYSQFLDAGAYLLIKGLEEMNIHFEIISGDRTAKQRADIVKEYNRGDIKVLLISKAGGEGLDLKETNSVIILEPAWNDPNIRQVVGRAVRYQSHINLPPEEQVVNVYHLYVVKRDEYPYTIGLKHGELFVGPQGFPSIDIYLRNLSIIKERANRKVLERIKEIAI